MFLPTVLCSLLQHEVSCVLPPKLENTSCFCLPSFPWRLMSICCCILLLGYFSPFIYFFSEFVVCCKQENNTNLSILYLSLMINYFKKKKKKLLEIKPATNHFSICFDCMSVYLFISGYPSCSLYATSFPKTSFNTHFLSFSCPVSIFTIQLQNTISKSVSFRVFYVCRLLNLDDVKLGLYFFWF